MDSKKDCAMTRGIFYSESFLTLCFFFIFLNANSQSVIDGVNESLINSVPADKFDFSGSWTAYTYAVEFNVESNDTEKFERIDTISNVVFKKLIGFPSRAYSIEAIGTQNYWRNVFINLEDNKDRYSIYWLGIDGSKSTADVTTYGEMGVQFNIDIPDDNDSVDLNLFMELIRNEPERKE